MRASAGLLLVSLAVAWNGNAKASTVAPEEARLAGFFERLGAGEKQTVVVYGTSLTQYGTWVPAMDDWFKERFPGQVTLINSGGAGQHSDWGVAHIQDRVLAHHPEVVFIEFSFNDAHQRFKLSVPHCAENLDRMVRAIEGQNPRVAIVLQTMNVPWDSPKGFATAATDRPQLEAYNDNYRTYAKEHPLPLLDHVPAWKRMQEEQPERFRAMIPDGTHPGKNGHLAVTWPGIKSLLEKLAGPPKS